MLLYACVTDARLHCSAHAHLVPMGAGGRIEKSGSSREGRSGSSAQSLYLRMVGGERPPCVSDLMQLKV